MSYGSVSDMRSARKGDGSNLEYGFDYHVKQFRSHLEKGIPTRNDQVNDYIKKAEKFKGDLEEWYQLFMSLFGSSPESSDTIGEVNSLFAMFHDVVTANMIMININRVRDARKNDGSVLEYGLEYHLNQMKNALEKGIPSNSNQVDAYLNKLDLQNTLLLEWLDAFRSDFEEFPEAQPTISECVNILSLYERVVVTGMLGVNIDRARNARKNDGSVLEYGLEYHLNQMKNALESGLPDRQDRVEDYLSKQKQNYDLLREWLGSFTSSFGKYIEAKPTIDEATYYLDLYNSVVGNAMMSVNVNRAINARRADGSVLEYGLEYEMRQLQSMVDSGVPQDLSKANAYLEKAQNHYNLLSDWLNTFRSAFGTAAEAQDTINSLYTLFEQYQYVVGDAMGRIYVQRACEARKADGSVLEYGLDYELRQLNNYLEKDVPQSASDADTFIEKGNTISSRLQEWLDSFIVNFSIYPESYAVIIDLSDRLYVWRSHIRIAMDRVNVQRAIEARKDDGSVLEYGLEYATSQFKRAVLEADIPSGNNSSKDAQAFFDRANEQYSLLQLWYSEFYSQFSFVKEAYPIISELNDLFEQYDTLMRTSEVPFRIQKAKDARRADGSVLEYGLDYQTGQLQRALDSGFPSNPDLETEYLDKLSKISGELREWLESFKQSFGIYQESFDTIEQTENLLDQYDQMVSSTIVPYSISRFVNARKSDGSILEYGLDYELSTLNNLLEKDFPQETKAATEYLKKAEEIATRLSDFNTQFIIQFGMYPESLETMDNIRNTLNHYQETLGSVLVSYKINAAVQARKADGSNLEYGLDYHLNSLKTLIEKDVPADTVEAGNYFDKGNTIVSDLEFWLNSFKSNFKQSEIADIVSDVQGVLLQFKDHAGAAMNTYRVNLARNARKNDGSLLEYGLEYHLTQITTNLEKDFPSNANKAKEYLNSLEEMTDVLKEWYNIFIEELGTLEESKETILEIESCLERYESVVGDNLREYQINRFCSARKEDGSILEYGLDYQLNTLTSLLESTIPSDVKELNTFFQKLESRKEPLELWLSEFKALFNQYEQSHEVISRVKSVLQTCEDTVGAQLHDFLILKAVSARKEDGSVLEYGLEYHLGLLDSFVENFVPETIKKFDLLKGETLKDQLEEWYSSFLDNFGLYPEAEGVKSRVLSALDKYTSITGTAVNTINIEAARNARKEDGSNLEYGLEYHLATLSRYLEKGIPLDIFAADKYMVSVKGLHSELKDWLDQFKTQFQCEEAKETIEQVENVLSTYDSTIGIEIAGYYIRKARTSRIEQGSVLEYGLDYHLNIMNGISQATVPSDSKSAADYMERASDAVSKAKTWLKSFTEQFSQYPEGKSVIEEVQTAIDSIIAKLGKELSSFRINLARSARSDDGSILPYGLDYQMTSAKTQLAKYIPSTKSGELFETVRSIVLPLKEWLKEFIEMFEGDKNAEDTKVEVQQILDEYEEKYSTLSESLKKGLYDPVSSVGKPSMGKSKKSFESLSERIVPYIKSPIIPLFMDVPKELLAPFQEFNKASNSVNYVFKSGYDVIKALNLDILNVHYSQVDYNIVSSKISNLPDKVREMEKAATKVAAISNDNNLNDDPLVIKFTTGLQEFREHYEPTVSLWSNLCELSVHGKKTFGQLGDLENIFEQFKNTQTDTANSTISLFLGPSIKFWDVLDYIQSQGESMKNKSARLTTQCGWNPYEEYFKSEIDDLIERTTTAHIALCLKLAPSGTARTKYARKQTEKNVTTYTFDYKDNALKALAKWPEKVEEAKVLCDKAEEDAIAEQIRRDEEEARRKEQERLARIQRYTDLFPEHLTPFEGGTMNNWAYSANGKSLEEPPTMKAGNTTFTWYGSESEGKLAFLSQEEHGWGLFDGSEFKWYCAYGLVWVYETVDNITWNRTCGSVPKIFKVTDEKVLPIDNPYPNQVQGSDISGTIPPCVSIAISLFQRNLAIIQEFKAEYEYRRAFNATKERILQRTLDKLQKIGKRSCRGCNTSGSNIYICPDCYNWWCTRCRSGSVNVCDSCNSYNGMNTPSFTSQIPSRQQPSDDEVVREMRY